MMRQASSGSLTCNYSLLLVFSSDIMYQTIQFSITHRKEAKVKSDCSARVS